MVRSNRRKTASETIGRYADELHNLEFQARAGTFGSLTAGAYLSSLEYDQGQNLASGAIILGSTACAVGLEVCRRMLKKEAEMQEALADEYYYKEQNVT